MPGVGDCYQVAAELAGGLVLPPAELAELLALLGEERAELVHGEVTGTGAPVAGVRFGHAWVELCGLVIDFSNGGNVVIDRRRYYEAGGVRSSEVRRYSRSEVLRRIVAEKHWGPW